MYAENKIATPPPILVLGWNMRDFGGLPYPGGQLDQPYAMMAQIRTAINTEQQWKAWKNTPVTKHVEIMQSNPDYFKTMAEIQKMVSDE